MGEIEVSQTRPVVPAEGFDEINARLECFLRDLAERKRAQIGQIHGRHREACWELVVGLAKVWTKPVEGEAKGLSTAQGVVEKNTTPLLYLVFPRVYQIDIQRLQLEPVVRVVFYPIAIVALVP